MTAKTEQGTRKRIRATLLALLWVWAICIFLVLDLFLNVAEFDRVRPRAESYRAMRFVAHQMVGEPYREDDEFAAAAASEAAPRPVVTQEADPLAEVRVELATVRELQRRRTFDGLCKQATTAKHAIARIAAIRGLGNLFGARSREFLLERVHNEKEDDKVRAAAARYLSKTGDGARDLLGALARADLPDAVRTGAVHGLVKLDRAEAGN